MKASRVGAAVLLLLGACTAAPGRSGPRGAAAPGGEAPGVRGLPDEERLLVPPGYGSLRQEEITLTLRQDAVQVKVTPLEEWMIRLLAPDTYQRLSALVRTHGTGDGSTLFLVSFYSEEDGAAFHPEDLRLETPGRRWAPRAIRPLTGGWGTQRLHRLQPHSAVYAFDPDVDFDVDLVAEYRGVRNAAWAPILRNLLAEQARARARAGVGSDGGPSGRSARTSPTGAGGGTLVQP